MAQSALDKYNRVSDYLFSNARLDTLKSPTIPYSPPNPLQMSKLRRVGTLAAAGVVAALIVLTSYLRFTVKKAWAGPKKSTGWNYLGGSIPYERKTHSLREVLKKKRNKRPLLISSHFDGHAVHKAGELQRMMNLPCLAELPVVVQKVREKTYGPFPDLESKRQPVVFREYGDVATARHKSAGGFGQ